MKSDFFLASFDIIEPLFGKLKNFVHKARLKEIGKNILLLPLFVTEFTCDMVDQALQEVRMSDPDVNASFKWIIFASSSDHRRGVGILGC